MIFHSKIDYPPLNYIFLNIKQLCSYKTVQIQVFVMPISWFLFTFGTLSSPTFGQFTEIKPCPSESWLELCRTVKRRGCSSSYIARSLQEIFQTVADILFWCPFLYKVNRTISSENLPLCVSGGLSSESSFATRGWNWAASSCTSATTHWGHKFFASRYVVAVCCLYCAPPTTP